MAYKKKFAEMSDEMKKAQKDIWDIAVWYGLDPFETEFVLVDHKTLHRVASTHGMPVMYPSWKWGMEERKLEQKYKYGLMNIYEMVINTDRSIAYMFNTNSDVDHKTVMAHVFGHTDFFKNNYSFMHTNRDAVNYFADSAKKVEQMMHENSYAVVEAFLNRCFSIENLVDPYEQFIVRASTTPAPPKPVDEKIHVPKLRRGYMSSFIDTQRIIDEQRKEIEKKRAKYKLKQKEGIVIPEEGVRDILGFLRENGKLEDWQRDILDIKKNERLYFIPQIRTKTMNEGWAVYWHRKIMVEMGVAGNEGIIEYAKHTAGTLGSPGFNPYRMGLDLWDYIEEFFNRNKDSELFDRCKDRVAKDSWGKEEIEKIEKMDFDQQRFTRGRKMLFLIRKMYTDETFLRDFFTPEFAQKYNYYNWKVDDKKEWYIFEDREFQKTKQRLLKQFTAWEKPVIRIMDYNHEGVGGLYLRHEYRGIPISNEHRFRDATLRNIQHMWGRPVFFESARANQRRGTGYLLKFDGENFDEEEIQIPTYKDLDVD